MKIRIKLFGELKRRTSGYQTDKGLEMEIPEGSDVSDLLTLLGISAPPGAAVIMDGRVLSPTEKLLDGSTLNLFRVMYGG
jgi:sulfur carrier protein ThiS